MNTVVHRKPVLLLVIIFLAAFVHAQNGLVAHWSFDEAEGDTLLDMSGMNNHGTNYGAVRVTGVIGNALYFDGENDYVRIPADGKAPPQHLRYLDKGSISLWFKATEIPVDFGIAPLFYYGSAGMCDFMDAANRGLIIELGHTPIHFGSERIYYTVWNNGCWLPSLCFDSRHAIPKNKWNHFVVVVGESYNTGYLNGKEMHDRRYNFANGTWSQFFADALVHEKLWLGKGYWDRTTQYFNGALDDIRIYDRPLSAAEVSEMYESAFTTSVFDKPASTSSMRVFPNPASDFIMLDADPGVSGNYTVQILNSTGMQVYGPIKYTKNIRIPVGHLQEGIYIVKLTETRKQINFLGKFYILKTKIYNH